MRLPGVLVAVASGLSWAAMAASAGAYDIPWTRVETAHFIVYGHNSETFIASFARQLEDFDGLMRAYHNRPVDEPVDRKLLVFFIPEAREFPAAMPGAPAQAAGVYLPTPNDIYAVSTSAGVGGLTQVAFHEYTHHFMMQYYAGAYPAWFNEGYADYFSTTKLGYGYTSADRMAGEKGFAARKAERDFSELFKTSKVEVGDISLGRTYDIERNRRLFRTGELIARPAWDAKPEYQSLYYAQAWLITHWIMDSKDRRAALTRYLELSRAGCAAPKAWEAAFQISPEETDKQISAYAATVRAQAKIGNVSRTWPEPKLTVSEAPRAQAEVMLDIIAMKSPARPKDAPAVLARLKKASARAPKDSLIQVAYARAEADFGERRLGEAALRKLLAKAPGDIEAKLQLARSLMDGAPADGEGRTGAFREAGALLAEVVKLAPRDYRGYYLYARSRQVEAGYPSENTLNVLLNAVTLAPQVAEIRLAAAEAAYQRKEAEVTQRMIEPLLQDPHAAQFQRRAHQLDELLPKVEDAKLQACQAPARATPAVEAAAP